MLNLTNNHVFIYRDVKFVEIAFPYNKHTTSSYMNHVPTPTYTDCDLPTDTNLENEPKTPQNHPHPLEPHQNLPTPLEPELAHDTHMTLIMLKISMSLLQESPVE